MAINPCKVNKTNNVPYLIMHTQADLFVIGGPAGENLLETSGQFN